MSWTRRSCATLLSTTGVTLRVLHFHASEICWHVISTCRQANYRNNHSLVILDEGMSEASCRALLDMKVTTGVVVQEQNIRIPDQLFHGAAEAALSNARQCIVGLIERMQVTISLFVSFSMNYLILSLFFSSRKRSLYCPCGFRGLTWAKRKWKKCFCIRTKKHIWPSGRV